MASYYGRGRNYLDICLRCLRKEGKSEMNDHLAKKLVEREKLELEERKEKVAHIRLKVKKLLKEKYPDVRLYLVGSVARGEMHQNSDIDFLLDTDIPPKKYSHLYKDIESICCQYKIPFHLIDYSEIKNHKARQSIQKEVSDL